MASSHATHDRLTADDDVGEASPRSFGFVIATVLAIYGAGAPLYRHQPLRMWPLAVAALLVVAALAVPRSLGPAARAWQRIGLLLHYVVNPVVMAAIFYLAVTPFGIVMRVFGRGWKDRFDIDPSVPTYWVSRTDSPDSSMTHQF